MASADAPRTRRSFARLDKVLDVPNLIDIQRKSFAWLTDPEKGGLRETIDDISPIEDYTGNLAVDFGPFIFDEPVASIAECREKDLTYRAPADRQGRVRQPRDGRDPRAVGVHGRLPVDDRPRHVHHQRHRARRRDAARALPGRLPDGAQGPREAGLHRQPDAGPRLVARARDRQEGQRLRPHRPQAQAAGHRAAARDGLRRPTRRSSSSSTTRSTSAHDRRRPRGHAQRGGRADRAVQEAAPGRAAQRRERPQPAAPAVLRPQALRPHARRSLQAQLASRARHRPRDPHAHPRRHHRARQGAGLAAQAARPARGARGRDQGLRGRGGDASARARRGPPRRVRALRQPPPADRRRADPGGVPHRPVPHGARRARAPDHRGRRHDHAADDRQHPPGRGGAEGVLRLLAAVAVHGPDQLAGRAHAPPPPVGASAPAA